MPVDLILVVFVLPRTCGDLAGLAYVLAPAAPLAEAKAPAAASTMRTCFAEDTLTFANLKYCNPYLVMWRR